MAKLLNIKKNEHDSFSHVELNAITAAVDENSIAIEDLSASVDAGDFALQAQINQIEAKNAKVSLSVSPSVIFKGEETQVTVETNVSGLEEEKKQYVNAKIISGGQSIAHSDGAFKSSIVYKISKETSYVGSATYKNIPLKSCNAIIHAFDPIYIGAGATYNDVYGKPGCKITPAKTTPSGTYRTTTTKEKNKVFIIVPSNMKEIKDIVSGPVNMPYNLEGTKTLGGVSYKIYAGLESAAATIEFTILV